VPVIRLDVFQVCAREYRGDSVDLECTARVDRRDAGVGKRAAQDLAVEHARHLHVPDVLRLTGELLAAVLAWPRGADL
jgi:hypothetical protein